MVAQLVKSLPAMRETQSQSLEEEVATHSSILAWRIPRTRSWMDHSPWGHKESDTTRQLTLTHSSIYMSLCLLLMFFGKNIQLTLGETSFMKTGYILILLSLTKIYLIEYVGQSSF